HNRERKEKNLWSELGEGEPVRVVEVEDEHAEARFVAAEIAALVEEGFSGREIAVFYRTNAQSRVLEDVLVRQGIAYQVIGGPRVPHDDGVADVRRARALRARPRREGARAQRLHRDARERADDRGAGPHREPAGARRRRPRMDGSDGGAVALRLPAGDLALLRP